MDAVRHAADSYSKYKLYFDYLYSKIKEYDILPENSYNIVSLAPQFIRYTVN